MTIDRAKELLQGQTGFGCPYDANSAKFSLAEFRGEHGQGATDQMIQ